MSVKNKNIWEPTKKQLDDVILPAYTVMSKKCVFYIRKLDCFTQYIADMRMDIANAIISSYPEDQDNISNL